MPSLDLPRTRSYTNASDIPEPVWCTMKQHEAAANIVLPFAQKAWDSPPADHQLWVVQWDNAGNVEFVLSCTNGPLGNYPIFIFTPKSSAQLHREEKLGRDIRQSLKELILGLLSKVPPTRVFSVFSIGKVAKTFASVFVENTQGIEAIRDPYYDATFTFCTSETLKRASESISPLPAGEDIVITLLRGDEESHKAGIQSLCQAFSETSWPYSLNDARALSEAEMLLKNKQVWVHMIKRGEEEWDIACLVATTRESDNVTAITKVYTAERWRKRGCAARLVHRVCQDILTMKKRVVLYVGNGDLGELAAARKLYHKVGFQGLDPRQGQPDGVERWVEIGFTGTDLGYW